MNPIHLADLTLHAYLDWALDPTQRVEVDQHLASCPQCAARLESARALFATIDSLPDLSLEHDLAPGVLAAIRPKPVTAVLPTLGPRARLVLGLQVLLTLIVLASTLPLAAQTLSIRTWVANVQLPMAAQTVDSLIARSLEGVDGALQSLMASLQSFASNAQSFIANFDLLISSEWLRTTLLSWPMVGLALGLAALVILWLVGNSVLLIQSTRLARR